MDAHFAYQETFGEAQNNFGTIQKNLDYLSSCVDCWVTAEDLKQL